MRGIGSHAPRLKAMGRPKAPAHKPWRSRRSGRAGEPAAGESVGASESLDDVRRTRGFPPTRPMARPMARRIACPISMSHYQRSLVLCRPPERPQRDLVLRPGSRPVAAGASAPQPTGIVELGEDAPSRRSILPADREPTSDALSPLRRQNSRQEPGALAAHAGIWAGETG